MEADFEVKSEVKIVENYFTFQKQFHFQPHILNQQLKNSK